MAAAMPARQKATDEDILNFIFDPIGDRALFARPRISVPVEPLPSKLSAELREKEVNAIRLAESGKLDEAAALMREVVAAKPDYAAGYNNLAQVQRLLKQDDEALASLGKAIELAGDDKFTLRQAHTQRGTLRLVREDEEGARADFEAAAALGSDFARREAAKLNPYAKMCNAMLTEVFEKYSWSQTAATNTTAQQ